MKGDFSRDTFNPYKRFSRVLMQQGRVQLDADWNEQQDIQLHLLRTFIKDLIGPFGTPSKADGSEGDGFKISVAAADTFSIGPGHYYVDGILCENTIEDIMYLNQDDYPEPSPIEKLPYLVYLDVWERYISSIEDDEIREKALYGPDTASRSKVVWQVKVENNLSINDTVVSNDEFIATIGSNWEKYVKQRWQPDERGLLKARARRVENENINEPCLSSPEARYQGSENRLYRVEIHQSGSVVKKQPTFKWSRDNGSLVFPIVHLQADAGKTVVKLGNLGYDQRTNLAVGDWVEIVDDAYMLHNKAEPLLQVTDIDTLEMQVTLSAITTLKIDPIKNHPLLRRWDQKGNLKTTLTKEGTVIIEEVSEDDQGWIPLEDGIEIQFVESYDKSKPHQYRTGDFWLIPVRTATGDVEWPKKEESGGILDQRALPPRGIDHHYAPLAFIYEKKNKLTVSNLRRQIGLICK